MQKDWECQSREVGGGGNVNRVIRAGFVWKIRCEQPLEKGEGIKQTAEGNTFPRQRGQQDFPQVVISHF